MQTWAEVKQLPGLERNFYIYREVTRMSSTALYKAFIEVGASEDSATKAAEDVIQVSQLLQLATKTDLLEVKADLLELKADLLEVKADLKSDMASLRTDMAGLKTGMANQETRLIKWFVGSLFIFTGIIIASIGILIQIMLSPGVVQ